MSCSFFSLGFLYPVIFYTFQKKRGKIEFSISPISFCLFFHFYGTVTIFFTAIRYMTHALSKYLYSADLFPDRFHFTDFNLRFFLTVQAEDPLSAAIVKQSGSCIFSTI